MPGFIGSHGIVNVGRGRSPCHPYACVILVLRSDRNGKYSLCSPRTIQFGKGQNKFQGLVHLVTGLHYKTYSLSHYIIPFISSYDHRITLYVLLVMQTMHEMIWKIKYSYQIFAKYHSNLNPFIFAAIGHVTLAAITFVVISCISSPLLIRIRPVDSFPKDLPKHIVYFECWLLSMRQRPIYHQRDPGDNFSHAIRHHDRTKCGSLKDLFLACPLNSTSASASLLVAYC